MTVYILTSFESIPDYEPEAHVEAAYMNLEDAKNDMRAMVANWEADHAEDMADYPNAGCTWEYTSNAYNTYTISRGFGPRPGEPEPHYIGYDVQPYWIHTKPMFPDPDREV